MMDPVLAGVPCGRALIEAGDETHLLKVEAALVGDPVRIDEDVESLIALPEIGAALRDEVDGCDTQDRHQGRGDGPGLPRFPTDPGYEPSRHSKGGGEVAPAHEV